MANQDLTKKYKELQKNRKKFKVTAEEMSKFFPVVFIVTMVTGFYVAHVYVAPQVMIDLEFSLWQKAISYILGYWLFGQTLINWIGIKVTSNTFGTKPQKSESGDTIVPPKSLSIERDAEIIQIENGFFDPTAKKSNNNNAADDDDESMIYLRSKTNGQIYAVAMRNKDGSARDKTEMWPYWSWKPCFICDHQMPPRVHHCPLCQECVLKRDRHCFVTGNCVGLYNQRYFIVFAFWGSIGSIFALYFLGAYFYLGIYDTAILELWDIFLPATCVRWLLGDTEFYNIVICTLLYVLIVYLYLGYTFLRSQMRVLRSGLTNFEMENKVQLQNTNSFLDELRGVFGKYFFMNFVMPLHTVYRPDCDGIEWPNIKQ